IHNKSGDEINLFVRRSFSNHLWSWLNDSARFI
ncbi:MAG: sarcosine oxidase subunit gamma, partial [Candidatus Pelagibacterales bacterium]